MNSKIIIAGEGGQGVQVIAKIIAEIVFSSGKKVTYLPNFGVEQRGGVSLAFIEVSDHEISFPKFSDATLLVILCPRAIPRVVEYITKQTIVIFDNSLVPEESLDNIKVEKIAIPASYYAKEKLVPKSFNMIILGAILAELKIKKPKMVKKKVSEFFAEKYKKEPQLKHFNQRAIEVGTEIAEDLLRRKDGR